MIVCSCRAVSDRALLAALSVVGSPAEAVAVTGAGSDCGCCRDDVAALLADADGDGGCCGGPCETCPRRGTA